MRDQKRSDILWIKTSDSEEQRFRDLVKKSRDEAERHESALSISVGRRVEVEGYCRFYDLGYEFKGEEKEGREGSGRRGRGRRGRRRERREEGSHSCCIDLLK